MIMDFGMCDLCEYSSHGNWVREEAQISISDTLTANDYVFMGLQDSGSLTEYESKYFTFLENKYFKKDEIG